MIARGGAVEAPPELPSLTVQELENSVPVLIHQLGGARGQIPNGLFTSSEGAREFAAAAASKLVDQNRDRILEFLNRQ